MKNLLTFRKLRRTFFQALFEQIPGAFQFLSTVSFDELRQVRVPDVVNVRPFEQGYSFLVSLKPISESFSCKTVNNYLNKHSSAHPVEKSFQTQWCTHDSRILRNFNQLTLDCGNCWLWTANSPSNPKGSWYGWQRKHVESFQTSKTSKNVTKLTLPLQ